MTMQVAYFSEILVTLYLMNQIIVTEWGPFAVRRIGRLTLRWEVDVRMHLGKMKIQNWSKMAMDREAWKRIVEQARTRKEL
jgi:hypothetical protein